MSLLHNNYVIVTNNFAGVRCQDRLKSVEYLFRKHAHRVSRQKYLPIQLF